MNRCDSCSHLNPPHGLYCEECGTPLEPQRPAARPKVITVGREEDNTIIIPLGHSQVSRHHVRITLEDGRLFIEDLQTANGTTVNENPVRGRVPFSMRDRIRFGSYELDTDLLLPHLTAASQVASAPPPRSGAAVSPAAVSHGSRLPVRKEQTPPVADPASLGALSGPGPASAAGPVSPGPVPGPSPARPAARKYACPECGSGNVIREGIQRQGGGGGGCVGCLLLIIIIILAPGLVCGLGLVSGAVMYTYRWELGVGIVVVIIISVIIRLALGNRYQCQRCGARFQL